MGGCQQRCRASADGLSSEQAKAFQACFQPHIVDTEDRVACVLWASGLGCGTQVLLGLGCGFLVMEDGGARI